MSEKLSFSVAKLNDVKQINNPVGNFVKVCCEKFLGMIFNRSLRDHVEKENFCSYTATISDGSEYGPGPMFESLGT